MTRINSIFLIGLLSALLGCIPSCRAVPEPIYQFQFSDPDAFHLGQEGELVLSSKAKYRSFVLAAELCQTGRDYGHRDLCLFFGSQNPEQFYYVHLATKADNHAHNIFLVDKSARRKIATSTTSGINWGRNVWHQVKLERDTETGSIKVYFDNMQTPIMRATDKTFLRGQIGFGSFDDQGKFRRIRITD